MRFKWYEAIGFLALAYYSVEILIRRWVWHQIPSQVPSVWVWTILILNGVVVWLYGLRLVRQTKKEKS